MARWRALKAFLPGSPSWILYRTCNLATNLCLVQTIVNLELTAHLLFSHFTTGSVANDSIKKVGQRTPPISSPQSSWFRISCAIRLPSFSALSLPSQWDNWNLFHWSKRTMRDNGSDHEIYRVFGIARLCCSAREGKGSVMFIFCRHSKVAPHI